MSPSVRDCILVDLSGRVKGLNLEHHDSEYFTHKSDQVIIIIFKLQTSKLY